jgi:hypothetical protein
MILYHLKYLFPVMNLWGMMVLDCPIKSFLIPSVLVICSEKTMMSHIHYFLTMLHPYAIRIFHAPHTSIVACEYMSQNTTKSRSILYHYEQHCSLIEIVMPIFISHSSTIFCPQYEGSSSSGGKYTSISVPG